MNFLSIKILFETYKSQIYKKHGIDLSKIELKLGKNEEFPNNRDYAYTLIQKVPEVVIAPKIRKLSKNQIKGVLLHELGHVILLLKKNKNHSERKADQITKKFFGKHIYYDEKMVQTLKPSVHKLRPKILNPASKLTAKDLIPGKWYVIKKYDERMSYVIKFIMKITYSQLHGQRRSPDLYIFKLDYQQRYIDDLSFVEQEFTILAGPFDYFDDGVLYASRNNML